MPAEAVVVGGHRVGHGDQHGRRADLPPVPVVVAVVAVAGRPAAAPADRRQPAAVSHPSTAPYTQWPAMPPAAVSGVRAKKCCWETGQK